MQPHAEAIAPVNGSGPAEAHLAAPPEEGQPDLRLLLQALQAVRIGDFSVRLPGDQTGIAGKIADTFNEIVAANQRMAEELEAVGAVVGREGRTGKRVRFGLGHGAWGEMPVQRKRRGS